ncbi:MAG: Asp-tRNA(Asn)/Glu-tRNA(Gln) amidotransferase subunit GatC, partial [Bdellovibrionales bacterium]|nr:Asp-tRNA(Asn)/Glu-tRNA(Gln) amidotransferase subunit GatC [Bdellovibrionales bacterium]
MISEEDVVKIAYLARLEMRSGEITRFRGDLNAILEYVEQLNAVDVNGVEPL